MKKLIAKRPIQYMGRTYEPGDALPAHDGRMVGAWIRAGTATWSDTEAEQAEHLSANIQNVNNALAVGVLNAMGAQITDENGVFIGVAQLAERIVAVVRECAQEGTETPEGQEHGGAEKNVQEATEGKMLTGHMDVAQLERMSKADLINLAAKLDVDVSEAKNNAERAAILAAVTVQPPVDESGGGR